MSVSQEVIDDSKIVLEKTIRALNTKNYTELELFSNQTIHNSSIHQDVVSTAISKIIFGIYKIEQASFQKSIPFPRDKIAIELTTLHKYIEKGQISIFENEIDKATAVIEQIAAQFQIHNVINQAGVKKGKKLYEHGISIAQAAKAMNVSQWELYDYVGKSSRDEYSSDIDKRVAKRLIYTEKLFSK